MSATEINVAIFCVFLRAHPELAPAYTHQVQTFRASQFRPKPGQARTPITRVSAEDAKKFCEWLSTHSGLPCRLPTPQEWQHMAGNGLNGAPYPWGWESPEVRAVWKTDGPKPSGHYPSSPPGFDDVIGNVYEWSEDPDTGRSYIHGGAWSDDREEALQIQNPFEQPPDFRSTDIGFRILVERQ